MIGALADAPSVDVLPLLLLSSSVDVSKVRCLPFFRFLVAESPPALATALSGDPLRLGPPLQSSSMVGVVFRDCFLLRDCSIIRFSL